MSVYVVMGRKRPNAGCPSHVATITFKYDSSTTAHVHWLGTKAVEGRSNGSGYDRNTSACAAAAWGFAWPTGAHDEMSEAKRLDLIAFITALGANRGVRWDEALRKGRLHCGALPFR